MPSMKRGYRPKHKCVILRGRINVGSKNGIALPKEEWKVIPGHHEPLVTSEDFERVCPVHKRAAGFGKRKKNPLMGKLFAAGAIIP